MAMAMGMHLLMVVMKVLKPVSSRHNSGTSLIRLNIRIMILLLTNQIQQRKENLRWRFMRLRLNIECLERF